MAFNDNTNRRPKDKTYHYFDQDRERDRERERTRFAPSTRPTPTGSSPSPPLEKKQPRSSRWEARPSRWEPAASREPVSINLAAPLSTDKKDDRMVKTNRTESGQYNPALAIAQKLNAVVAAANNSADSRKGPSIALSTEPDTNRPPHGSYTSPRYGDQHKQIASPTSSYKMESGRMRYPPAATAKPKPVEPPRTSPPSNVAISPASSAIPKNIKEENAQASNVPKTRDTAMDDKLAENRKMTMTSSSTAKAPTRPAYPAVKETRNGPSAEQISQKKLSTPTAPEMPTIRKPSDTEVQNTMRQSIHGPPTPTLHQAPAGSPSNPNKRQRLGWGQGIGPKQPTQNTVQALKSPPRPKVPFPVDTGLIDKKSTEALPSAKNSGNQRRPRLGWGMGLMRSTSSKEPAAVSPKPMASPKAADGKSNIAQPSSTDPASSPKKSDQKDNNASESIKEEGQGVVDPETHQGIVGPVNVKPQSNMQLPTPGMAPSVAVSATITSTPHVPSPNVTFAAPTQNYGAEKRELSPQVHPSPTKVLAGVPEGRAHGVPLPREAIKPLGSPSPETKMTEAKVLATIEDIDTQITMIKKQIEEKSLKEKSAQAKPAPEKVIEEAPEQTPEEKRNEEALGLLPIVSKPKWVPMDDEFKLLCHKLCAENRLKAKKAQEIVIGTPDSIVLFPQDNACFKINQTVHERKKGLIKKCLSLRQKRHYQYMSVLGKEYRRLRKQWKSRLRKIEKKRADESKKEGAPTPSGLKDGAIPSDKGIVEDGTRRLGSSSRVAPPQATSSYGRTSSRLTSAGASDIIRSEYEQEQLLQAMADEEKKAKRFRNSLKHLPDMILSSNRQYCPKFTKNRNSVSTTDGLAIRCRSQRPLQVYCNDRERCNCPRVLAYEEQFENPWSDLEKCIFIDKFLQYPKNFHKIASFLTRKSTGDAISFYYLTKKKINYKALLREQQLRRRNEVRGNLISNGSSAGASSNEKTKSMGFSSCWSLAAFASVSLGVHFDSKTLRKLKQLNQSSGPAAANPEDWLCLTNLITDNSYSNFKNSSYHKLYGSELKRRKSKKASDSSGAATDSNKDKANQKRKLKDLDKASKKDIALEMKKAKKLKQSEKRKQGDENTSNLHTERQGLIGDTGVETGLNSGPRQMDRDPLATGKLESEQKGGPTGTPGAAPSGGAQGTKRVVQKWTDLEKADFMSYFRLHGKDWNLLTEKIPTKTAAQIKNYYQNYKNRLGLTEILQQRAERLCNSTSLTSGLSATNSTTHMTAPSIGKPIAGSSPTTNAVDLSQPQGPSNIQTMSSSPPASSTQAPASSISSQRASYPPVDSSRLGGYPEHPRTSQSLQTQPSQKGSSSTSMANTNNPQQQQSHLLRLQRQLQMHQVAAAAQATHHHPQRPRTQHQQMQMMQYQIQQMQMMHLQQRLQQQQQQQGQHRDGSSPSHTGARLPIFSGNMFPFVAGQPQTAATTAPAAQRRYGNTVSNTNSTSSYVNVQSTKASSTMSSPEAAPRMNPSGQNVEAKARKGISEDLARKPGSSRMSFSSILNRSSVSPSHASAEDGAGGQYSSVSRLGSSPPPPPPDLPLSQQRLAAEGSGLYASGPANRSSFPSSGQGVSSILNRPETYSSMYSGHSPRTEQERYPPEQQAELSGSTLMPPPMDVDADQINSLTLAAHEHDRLARKAKEEAEKAAAIAAAAAAAFEKAQKAREMAEQAQEQFKRQQRAREQSFNVHHRPGPESSSDDKRSEQ